MRACRAVLAGGSWRLGMSEEDVRAALDEGRALARELRRPAAVANLLVGVAGHYGVLGRAQAALDVATECAGLVDHTLGRGEILAIDVTTAYWSLVAGRIRDALVVLDRIVDRTEGDPRVGREIVSFSPLVWAEQVSAIALAQAGRFDECWPRMDRALRLAREHAMQENLAWVLGTPSIVGYFGRGTSGAVVPDLLRAAAEAVEIAAAVGTRYSQITASSNLAFASLLSGEYAACEERLTDCLASGRQAGTGRPCTAPWVPRTRRSGWCWTSSREAVNCRSCATENRETRQVIARARLAGLLSDSIRHRKLLIEAQDLFEEMGATGHAERVAGLLAELP